MPQSRNGCFSKRVSLAAKPSKQHVFVLLAMMTCSER